PGAGALGLVPTANRRARPNTASREARGKSECLFMITNSPSIGELPLAGPRSNFPPLPRRAGERSPIVRGCARAFAFMVAALALTTGFAQSLHGQTQRAAEDARNLERFALRIEPWQQENACGANCLFVFLRLHGQMVSHEEILAAMAPDERGLSLESL